MKLRLEPVEFRHLKWLREQRNKREVMDFCRQPYFLNEVNQEDWLKEVSRNRSMIPFIIADSDLKEGSDWVGYAALSNIDWIAKRGEISYFTATEHADKGYGKLAIPAVLEYGFRRLGFQKINTDTFAFNDKEVNFMISLGFKIEGRLIRHYFKRGELQDSIALAIFSENCKFEVIDPESKSL